MRLIRIPKKKATWTWTDREGKKGSNSVSFEDWATTSVETHPGFARGHDSVKKARRLLERLEGVKNGGTFKLEEPDWLAFKEAVDSHAWPSALIAVACEGYYDAVWGAESVTFKG